ncbi:type VI secretion system tip protein TssI/VgrG [Sorangium sp. So ce590]|uniref:type VI secretion system Vgr family protein n=1 Tax=Sorangium sp. So ce590 TaxID=3133317 RepID=UPI003F62921F
MRAAFELTVEGAPPLAVQSFDAFERTHVGGSVRVLARVAPGRDEALVPDELLGKKATLEITPKDALRDVARRFHGVVDAIEGSGVGALLTIVPRLMPLEDGSDHRIFLEKDAVTIAEELLLEAGLTLDIRVPARPEPRIQCVQAFESVLAFVRRILAEEGISLWVEHQESEDVVVLGQDTSACHDLPGGARLRVVQDGGMATGEVVTEVRLIHRVTHDGVAVSDYDPDRPTVDQAASVGEQRFQRFAYPGRHRSPEAGAARARLLLEEEQTEGVVLRARTTCRHVAVGFIVELEDAPRDDENGRFRILEVRHRGSDFAANGPGDLRYEAELVAVPAARPARPRRQPAKGLGGLQTMTIMGPPGAEMHTDAQGRVKARFRWDRLSPEDDTASAWIRPVQPPLSGGFFLPRAGWEVLVGFMNDPAPTGDTPLELGRLDNGQAPPAESLPGQKVRSNWGTQSTGGSGKQNQIRFDDAAGNEGMHFAASKDATERTENDKVVRVTADEENIVGGNHTSTVTLQQVTTVTSGQTYSVGGNRDVTTTGVLGIFAASESVSVGATRKLTVGGDYEMKAATLSRIVGAAENVVAIQSTNRHVTGASTIAVGGTWTEIGGLTASMGVLGASTLTAGGPLSVSAKNVSINASVLSEKYAGLYRAHAGADFTVGAPVIKLKAGGAIRAKGADVSFKAKTRIVLKAGGVTVTITPASITVKGKLKGDSTSVVTTKEEVK